MWGIYEEQPKDKVHSHAMEHLIVLADATEYWHFGGRQASDLSDYIESGQAAKLMHKLSDAKAEEVVMVRELILPRLSQLKGWAQQEKKARVWPIGFRFSKWDSENFDTMAEWHADKKDQVRRRRAYFQEIQECCAGCEELISQLKDISK